jgi:hypothetical protein
MTDTKIEVGPVGNGSYAYSIGGLLSAEVYANPESALADARRPQTMTYAGWVPKARVNV